MGGVGGVGGVRERRGRPMTEGFPHERLVVFRKAEEFAVWADELAGNLPPGSSHLADQLRRAAISIPLNIAEGATEFSPKEKVRFYRIALRSAGECSAILSLLRRRSALNDSAARTLLLEIVAMLIALCKRVAPSP